MHPPPLTEAELDAFEVGACPEAFQSHGMQILDRLIIQAREANRLRVERDRLVQQLKTVASDRDDFARRLRKAKFESARE